MHIYVYVCMFGVQPADPVTFSLLLQTNVATTTTRVRDDRRHFLRCLSTESGRYESERIGNWFLIMLDENETIYIELFHLQQLSCPHIHDLCLICAISGLQQLQQQRRRKLASIFHFHFHLHKYKEREREERENTEHKTDLMTHIHNTHRRVLCSQSHLH